MGWTKRKPNVLGKYQQLCWDCHLACGGCSWSDSLTPVEGWDAEVTKDDMTLIYDCPQFCKGKTYLKDMV